MSTDQKECQAAFEQWSKHYYNIEKRSDEDVASNPYLDLQTMIAYHAYKAAWRNRTEALKPKPFEVGDFELSCGIENDTKVWIQRKDGEGGDFDAKEFEKAIEKFFIEWM